MLTQRQIECALVYGTRVGRQEGDDCALATRLIDMTIHDIEKLRGLGWVPQNETATVYYCRGCIEFAAELGIPEYAVELLKVSLAERLL